MNRSSAIKILVHEKYGLVVQSIKKINTGVINENYIVQAQGKKYIFKIYNLRNTKQLQFEINVVQKLGELKYPCPRLLHTQDGQLHTQFQERHCLLYEYIPGKPLKTINKKKMFQIGIQLGKMHALLQKMPQKVVRESWELSDMLSYVETEKKQMDKKNIPGLKNFLLEVKKEFADVHLSKALPVGITHQDVKPENIIEHKSSLTFIDFDNVYRGLLIVDALTPVIWMCFPKGVFSISLFESYMKGYQQSRHLKKFEKRHLFDALRFRLLREAFVWPMRFESTKAKPKFTQFNNAYKSLVKHKSFFVSYE